MKPFKPKRYRRRRLITYKRLFLITFIVFLGYLWYQQCDEIIQTENQTMEVK